jgi:general secretion pathway protein A
MVLEYYKLAEQPFGVTPDPRFLFLTPTHREALASVLYGVCARRGFSALIAKPGMGKTTLLFEFLNHVRDQAKTAFLFQPQCSPNDLLRSLLADIGIDEDGTDFVRMHRKLIDCLLSESRRGKQLVVVVDEAQNLGEPVLELLRLLSNFETSREKLMHLILVGQPQLAEKLSSPSLTQLRQRISIVARLDPLSAEETYQYIEHRLHVVGCGFAGPHFTKNAMAMIAEHAQGIPRNINNLCFNAMSLGCALKQRTIDVDAIGEVIRDLDLRPIYAEPRGADKAETPPTPRQVTTSFSKTKPPRPPRKIWALRFALGGSFMALVGSPVTLSRRPITDVSSFVALPTTMPAPQSQLAFPSAPVEPSSTRFVRPASVVEAPQTTGLRTIQVLPGQTLYHVMIENFGRYDQQTLTKIRELNPSLSNPARIKAGKNLRIPGENKSEPQAVLPAFGRVLSGPVAGTEKP